MSHTDFICLCFGAHVLLGGVSTCVASCKVPASCTIFIFFDGVQHSFEASTNGEIYPCSECFIRFLLLEVASSRFCSM